jgi:predicted nucleic acid-binding protein
VIVLDTNVISEPLRPTAADAVTRWLNAQPPGSLYTTAINVAELLAGIAVLPAGKRRRDLDIAVRASLSRLFSGRVLPFDGAAADAFALIAEESRDRGLGVPHDDALIAAIARAHGFSVATRNGSNFAGAGIELVDPWAHGADD